MKIHYLIQIAVVLLLSISNIVTTTFSLNAATKPPHQVRSLRILVLSTMLADEGIGEWGFAALVEVDGRRILFDTGARPDTVLKNARELGINLTDIKEVVLSHNHDDHTGGLLTLRRKVIKQNTAALSRAHVGKGVFLSRATKTGEGNNMVAVKSAYQALGGLFIEHDQPMELFPGVWITGPVPRIHPERNWSGKRMVKTSAGMVEDTIAEDQSLIFNTAQGIVILSGCGHAGIINTMEYARKQMAQAPVYAAIGGFHLFEADDNKLQWTASKLREFGLKHLLGAHCTGIEAVYRLRKEANLSRQTCVVSAVGSSFSLDKGIEPLSLAR